MKTKIMINTRILINYLKNNTVNAALPGDRTVKTTQQIATALKEPVQTVWMMLLKLRSEGFAIPQSRNSNFRLRTWSRKAYAA